MENSIETRKMGEEKILERWSVLITNAQGNGPRIYNRTMELFQELKAPGINANLVKLRTSEMEKERKISFLAKYVEKEYLMVTNDRLKDFRMYAGARDYGKALYVSWYLICEPSLLKGLISGFLTKDSQALSFNLPLFREEELTAYVTAVHHALKDASKEVSESVDFDFAKVDQKSRGFLNVS